MTRYEKQVLGTPTPLWLLGSHEKPRDPYKNKKRRRSGHGISLKGQIKAFEGFVRRNRVSEKTWREIQPDVERDRIHARQQSPEEPQQSDSV